jgi:hypothetical protein
VWEYCAARGGCKVTFEADCGHFRAAFYQWVDIVNNWILGKKTRAEYALYRYLSYQTAMKVKRLRVDPDLNHINLPMPPTVSHDWFADTDPDFSQPAALGRTLTAPILRTALRDESGERYVQRFCYFPEIDWLILVSGDDNEQG